MDTTLDVRNSMNSAPERLDACCGGRVVQSEAAPLLADSLVERLKALADPTRLRMLELLARQEGKLCVCDITAQFDLHQPTISHHLRILRQAGLIATEKRGVWSYYWATDEGRRSLSLVRELA